LANIKKIIDLKSKLINSISAFTNLFVLQWWFSWWERIHIILKISGECIGQFLHAEIDVPSQEDCLNICKEFQRCNWFTYIQSSLSCLLFSDCQTLDETCLDCISGESRCTMPDDGKETLEITRTFFNIILLITTVS